MAFHVACPITCRRICFCSLGFPRSLNGTKNATKDFLDEVNLLSDFLGGDSRKEDGGTIQVAVPKVVPPPPQEIVAVSGGGGGGGDVVDESASMKAKRDALQRKGAAAMIAAEEYARRLESGDVVDTSSNLNGEEQGQSNVKVFCRMCNRVENEGSEKAKKMLSCKSCSKKYHRSCLKSWSNNRDLFHWSSWTCRACRICEACRRTGDPSKFMFCKRCDGAYHCYCLQPPHKNVSTGPYLCPKHTKCHSCASNVPGNGLSVRWFLGYTCCDACGRLFVKGNYCPVCLKVYRDSESTPMVCCDHCQRWVHCQCDDISDERYHQFQVDGNLQYTCPTCRGECYQVKNLEDAVQELWRRKNVADKDLITSLRASAGLPTQEEIFSISPYSDDEDSGPLKLKSDSGFKFSFKNFPNNSPTKMNDYGKKSSNKKSAKKKDSLSFMTGKIDARHSFEGHSDIRSLHSLDDMQSQRNEGPDIYSSPATGSLTQTEVSCPINQTGILKRKSVDEVMVSDEERKPRVVRIKRNKANILDSEESGKHGDKSQNVKKNKLVINLGARKINVASSPLSDNASFQRDQDLVTANGNENPAHSTKGNKFALDRHDGAAGHIDGKGSRVDSGQSKHLKVYGREGNTIKFGKVKPNVSEFNFTSGRGNMSDGGEVGPLEGSHIMRGKRSTHGMINQVGLGATSRGERTYLPKQSEGSSDVYDETHDHNHMPSHSLPKDSKPLLKFKIKKPIESQNSHQEEEKTTIKGQRSKRKRPSPFKERSLFNDSEGKERSLVNDSEGASQSPGENINHENMDANWILMKLGSDAIGKRVEVHQISDDSWHKGEVTGVVEGTSNLHVTYEDGKVSILELRKQGVRFVPQKQKRSKT